MKPSTSLTRSAASSPKTAVSAVSAVSDDTVDERQIDRWVAELRQIVVVGQVEIAAKVGEFLIANVYGSVDMALSHAARKPASLRRLTERAEEFGMRPTGLRFAVPMALQVRQLGVRLGHQLGVDQHRALLPVRDPADKKLLAEAAVDARWTAEELRRKVRGIQRPHLGGRPTEPAARVLIRALDRTLGGVDFARLRGEADAIEAAEARRLLGRVNAAQGILERLEKLLTRAATRRG